MIDYVKRLAGPYTGAGLKTFSFSFKIFEETDVYVATSFSDLEAAVNLSYGTDYSVTMNSDQDAAPGGSVTLTNASRQARFSSSAPLSHTRRKLSSPTTLDFLPRSSMRA